MLLVYTADTIFSDFAETIFTYFVSGRGAKYCDKYLCLSVCSLNSKITQPIFINFLCILSVVRSIESISWTSDIHCLSSSECSVGGNVYYIYDCLV